MSSRPVEPALTVVRGMAAALSPDARGALARALRLQLGEPPTATERRLRDYSALAAMLDRQAKADVTSVPATPRTRRNAGCWPHTRLSSAAPTTGTGPRTRRPAR